MRRMITLLFVALALFLVGCEPSSGNDNTDGNVEQSSKFEKDEELLDKMADTVTLDGVTYHRPFLASEDENADELYEDYLGYWALYSYENGAKHCAQRDLFIASKGQLERLFEEYSEDGKGTFAKTIFWPQVMYYRTGTLSDDPTYWHYHISFYDGEGRFNNPEDTPNHIICVDVDRTDVEQKETGDVKAPTASHNSGSYDKPFYLELEGEGTIYYSTNVNAPNMEYTESLYIDKNTTVKAKIVVNGVESEVKTWDFTITEKEDESTISPAKKKVIYAGRILYRPLLVSEVKGFTVTNTSTDYDRNLKYALLNYYDAKAMCEKNGGDLPSDLSLLSQAWGSDEESGGNGTTSGGYAQLNEKLMNYLGWPTDPYWESTGTGYYISNGVQTDWYDDGDEKDELYLVSCTVQPKASKPSGKYDGDISVDFNVSGNIYFTLDGTEPSEASSIYNSAINVGKSAVLKVMIVNDDGTVTRLEDYIYEIKPDMPTVDKEPGEYETGVDVALSGEAQVYYTIDGSDPTTDSAIYKTPISITANTTIKAIVFDGQLSSDVAVFEYVIK